MLAILLTVAAQSLASTETRASAPSAVTASSSARAPSAPEAGPPRRPPFELTAQIVLGGGARFQQPLTPTGFFSLAWRGDVLFLRDSPRAVGLGPALSVRIDHFADVAPAVGASLLLPISEAFPLVITPSAALRWDGASVAPGLSGRLFWGVRSHNYHSVYALSMGFWVEARHFFGTQQSTDVAAGVDVDLQLLAMPFLALYVELFRRTRTQ